MNKYQIQVDHRTENKWDWICVFANSDQEAIQNAKIKLYDFQNPTYSQADDHDTKYWKDYYKEKFQGYIISSYIPIFSVERDCEPSKDYDTIISSNTKENQDMAFFKVNWNNYTEELSKKADTENWSNETYPNNGILTNYIVKTYDKLTDEKKIIIGQNYALFNTGLFTKYYEPIYAYQSGTEISFLTAYELGGIGITERPERANYFENPDLLLFDWHYAIDVHYPHILEDEGNQKRIPKDVFESKNIVNTLDGAINKMKKKVSANYKLAIPQYYEGKIQLLLPLCLADDNIPDLALVVTKTNNIYRGHTCLTLDMAYNNARLIARPESNWLNP